MLEFLEINLVKKYIITKNNPRTKIPIKEGKIQLDLRKKKLNIMIDFGKPRNRG